VAANHLANPHEASIRTKGTHGLAAIIIVHTSSWFIDAAGSLRPPGDGSWPDGSLGFWESLI